MKKFLIKISKALGIGMIAITLVTISVDATDHFDNMSESIIGHLFFKNDGPCPANMIFIMDDQDGFCIDEYEVSPSKDCPFINPENQKETRSNLDLKTCRPVALKEKTPWRFISQTQAQLACTKAGKRLPTNKEWYLASLGTPDKNEDWNEDDCQVDNNWEKQPGKTGSAKNCISSFGVYDMIGNVWEWVSGEVDNGFLNNKKISEQGFISSVNTNGEILETNKDEADENFNKDFLWSKEKGSRGLIRGGYWDNKSDAGIYSLYASFEPTYVGAGVGFRCVK